MNHLAPFRLIGRTPEGTCPDCAVAHPESDPHDRDSLTYQYRFYAKHGRWPTWDDAMAQCTPEHKEVWMALLREVLAKYGKVYVEGEVVDA